MIKYEEITAELFGNKRSWNFKIDKKEETNEVVNKKIATMRKHRKKIKEKIEGSKPMKRSLVWVTSSYVTSNGVFSVTTQIKETSISTHRNMCGVRRFIKAE